MPEQVGERLAPLRMVAMQNQIAEQFARCPIVQGRFRLISTKNAEAAKQTDRQSNHAPSFRSRLHCGEAAMHTDLLRSSVAGAAQQLPMYRS
ncbi:hypothetical protein [Massilia frigida]|uniref:hypothetical protein n=1 Tax=Massilia frigida TaxID=2609281 RepID=UPI0014213569|nr:hypothetical protein [Massilia frigida]